jgi:hypothetical protein
MTETETEQRHSAPTPDPALRRLDFLVGTWRIEGATVPDLAGPSMTSISTETFEWLPGEFFLVHRWDAVFGNPEERPGLELPGGAIQRGIMFYGFDSYGDLPHPLLRRQRSVPPRQHV